MTQLVTLGQREHLLERLNENEHQQFGMEGFILLEEEIQRLLC